MRDHGIDAAVVSWWGRPGTSKGDSQGVLTDDAVAMVLDAASEVGGIGVALHLEPYAGRSVESIREDLEHLNSSFALHPGIYREGTRPVFYVYDSYHIDSLQWQRLLGANGDLSVRGGVLDGIFLGLWLESSHGQQLAGGGFDGAYSYFAADGFSYGATSSHWSAMSAEAKKLGLLFVPSVGPGYDDSKIRPWNQAQIREREGGSYYERMWRSALASGARWVSITSYNEWGEGTQIEGAIPRDIDVQSLAPQGLALSQETRDALRLRVPTSYKNYLPGDPQNYMDATLEFSRQLKAEQVDSKEL